MAVPKSRHTKSKRDRRRSQISLTKKELMVCSNCGEKKLPHRVCEECGHYKKEEVLKKDEEKKKKTEEKTSGPLGGGALDWRKMSKPS